MLAKPVGKFVERIISNIAKLVAKCTALQGRRKNVMSLFHEH